MPTVLNKQDSDLLLKVPPVLKLLIERLDWGSVGNKLKLYQDLEAQVRNLESDIRNLQLQKEKLTAQDIREYNLKSIELEDEKKRIQSEHKSWLDQTKRDKELLESRLRDTSTLEEKADKIRLDRLELEKRKMAQTKLESDLINSRIQAEESKKRHETAMGELGKLRQDSQELYDKNRGERLSIGRERSKLQEDVNKAEVLLKSAEESERRLNKALEERNRIELQLAESVKQAKELDSLERRLKSWQTQLDGVRQDLVERERRISDQEAVIEQRMRENSQVSIVSKSKRKKASEES